jgi:tetratricopeptide (TPR) repeat protein
MNEYPPQAVEHYLRGIDFAHEAHYQDAIGEFKLAIAASPLPFVDAYIGVADAHREWWKDPDATLAAYQRVVEIDPTQTPSWCWLALIAFVFRSSEEQHKRERGERDMREARGMMDIGKMTIDQTRKGRQVGKYRDIEQKALNQVRLQFPLIDPGRDGMKLFNTMHAINTLADKYADEGFTREAAEWYQRVAEVKPDLVVFDDEEDDEGLRLLTNMADHAKRRLVLVKEQIVQKEEQERRRRNRNLIWVGVAVVAIIILILLCSATTAVPPLVSN